VTRDSRVLDLGSGHGGGAHALVQKWGCRVQARRRAARRARRPRARRARAAPAPPGPSCARPLRAQCFNIGPQQNEMNRARCVELGIADRVDIALGALPQRAHVHATCEGTFAPLRVRARALTHKIPAPPCLPRQLQ
jgi:hypothetical protein